jgi:predicted ATPase
VNLDGRDHSRNRTLAPQRRKEEFRSSVYFIFGFCGSGKSTLAERMKAEGKVTEVRKMKVTEK